MVTIPYVAENFPVRIGTPLFQGNHTLATDWAEIIRSAVTVGRASWADVFPHAQYSIYEATYRILICAANLKQDGSGALLKTGAYNQLDPSEKGAISYFLGLTMAKLFSERLLKVRWLMHLDKYPNLGSILRKGKKRPDFVGLDAAGNWIVVEAKGRTGPASKALMSDAKEQCRNLRSIQSQYPSLRMATAVCFKGAAAQVLLEDPEDFDEDAEVLDLSRWQLITDYYRPIVDLLDGWGAPSIAEGESTYIANPFPDFGVTVGLDKRVYDVLKKTEWDPSEDLVPCLPKAASVLGRSEDDQRSNVTEQPSSAPRNPMLSVGLDGVLVQLGPEWSPQAMMREPKERGRGRK